MDSTTKFVADKETIAQMMEKAGLPAPEEVSSLDGGMFNSAYAVKAGGFQYVVKIAPPPGSKIGTYERDMMRQELFSYDILREKTNIGLPAVYYRDTSRTFLPVDWFVMERLTAPRMQLDELKLEGEEAAIAHRKVASLAASYHRIAGTGYGYPQNGLFPKWSQAVKYIILNLITDAERYGGDAPLAEECLFYAEKFSNVLDTAPCRYINYDLWENNMFYDRNENDGSDVPGRIYMIDPERFFWGDPIADMIFLDPMHIILGEKKEALAGYNLTAEFPVDSANREHQIRYYIPAAIYGALMQVERFERFTPGDEGWRMDLMGAKMFGETSLAELKKL
ncbi:MAG: aminoglycoside phosphotransferase family protein [Treponema sp.]|nr:aminoglycoside phosphotransferase family protein [Treponema sp.]